jgi:HD-GYP domain-containing protein (c-di-GMP phosphodiesterase class II)
MEESTRRLAAAASVLPRVPGLARELAPLQEATDLPDLFAGLAQSVVVALDADACLVSLWDETRDVVRDVAASVMPPARLHAIAEEYALDDFPATRAVIDTGAFLEVSASDPSADPAERSFLRESGFARVLLSRFSLDADTVGTIETYRLMDRPFGPEASGQIDVLTTFARNAHSRIRLASKLEAHYTVTIEALVSALEARDPYTEAHAGRIRDIAMALGAALQLPREESRALKLGSILHDVGKIGIADAILLKPGPLSDDEWQVMRSHPEIGERMLGGIDFLVPALPIIRHHHERWDGTGYPDGLLGEGIPIGARIVSVCDAFDAMTSDRPYRRALSRVAACDELLRAAGRQFDPACAQLLVDIVSHMGEERLEERFVRYAS